MSLFTWHSVRPSPVRSGRQLAEQAEHFTATTGELLHTRRARESKSRISCTPNMQLFSVRVMNSERLVCDEEKCSVAVFSRAVLHDPALREPHEMTGTECATMRLERALKDVNAVRTWMRVPGVGEPGSVDDLDYLHPGVRVINQRQHWQLDP